MIYEDTKNGVDSAHGVPALKRVVEKELKRNDKGHVMGG